MADEITPEYLADLQPRQRMELYATVAQALYQNPTQVPTANILILSYGLYHDDEAMAEATDDFALVLDPQRLNKTLIQDHGDAGTAWRLARYANQPASSLEGWLDSVRVPNWVGTVMSPALSWLTGGKAEHTDELAQVGLFITTLGGLSGTVDLLRNDRVYDSWFRSAVSDADARRGEIDAINAQIRGEPMPGTTQQITQMQGPVPATGVVTGEGVPTLPDSPAYLDNPLITASGQVIPFTNVQGLPEGFAAAEPIERSDYPWFDALQSRERLWPAQYNVNDATSVYNGLTPQQLLELQDWGVRSGLINPEATGYFAGQRNAQTLNALQYFMGISNENAGVEYQTWESTAREMARQGDELGLSDDPDPVYPRKPYMAPDYATLSQQVKGDVDRRLGRPAQSWEIQLFTQQMQNDHRTAYEIEERYNEEVFKAQQAAIEGETSVPPEMQDVDLLARYQAAFDKHFKPEMQWDQAREDTQEEQQALFGSSRMVRNLLGAYGTR